MGVCADHIRRMSRLVLVANAVLRRGWIWRNCILRHVVACFIWRSQTKSNKGLHSPTGCSGPIQDTMTRLQHVNKDVYMNTLEKLYIQVKNNRTKFIREQHFLAAKGRCLSLQTVDVQL